MKEEIYNFLVYYVGKRKFKFLVKYLVIVFNDLFFIVNDV